MDFQWNTSYVNLQMLLDHARGDAEMIERYLRQLLEMLAEWTQDLRDGLISEDRKLIWTTLHEMKPQLSFFSVPDVLGPINELVLTYQKMAWEKLEAETDGILSQVQKACDEIEFVLNEYF